MKRAPDRVVIAGDWHGNTAWAVHVVYQASRRGVDTIVQVGDFGLWPGKWGVMYLDELDQALSDAGVELMWVDGNHDDHDQLTKWQLTDGVHQIRPRITHLPRGYLWKWHGRTWLALGGAVSIDRARRIPGRTWWPAEMITDDDVARCVAGGPADVMICHDSPAGAELLTEHLREFGFPLRPEVQTDSDNNRELVRQVLDAVRPELLLHGHYHWRYSDRVGSTRIEGLDADGDLLAQNVLLVDPRTLEVHSID